MAMIDDSQLVERLVRSDAISKKDLRRGLDLAKKRGEGLYETLVSAELIDERSLIKTVGKMLNVRPVWLGERTPDAEVTDRVPSSLAVRNRVLPLKLESGDTKERLVLAMIDPLDVLAMDEVATHTGVDVRPVLAGPRDLVRGLERVYGVSPTKSSHDGTSLDTLEKAAAGEADLSEDILEVEIDDGLNDDSWASFFDEAEDVDYTEDSAVISQDMQDRAISSILDAVDPDGEDDDAGEDSLKSLDEPLSRSQITGGIEPDLGNWEVDGALDGHETKDYAKIGQLFVYSPEEAVAKSEAEVVEPDDEVAESDDEEFDDNTSVEQSPFAHSSDVSESADDEDEFDDTGRTAYGFGPASMLADDSEQDAPKARSGDDDSEAASSDAPLAETFAARMAKIADLGDAGQRLLEEASSDELIYATVLALAQSGALDARVLLEYIPPKDDSSD